MTSGATRALCLMSVVCIAAAAPGQRQRPKPRDPLARFTTMLASDDARQRWQAVRGLIDIGSPAVPKLVTLLQSDRKEEKASPRTELAAHALARMERAAVAAIPALVELVRNGAKPQRFLAIRVLGHVGPFDPKRVPKIRAAIVAELCAETTKRGSWPRIAPAIARLATDPARATDAELLRRLHGRNATLRVQAAQWLANRVKKESRDAFVRQLTLALRERQPRHTEYGYTFQKIGFRRVVRTHREEHVRRQLAQILLRFQPNVPLEAWVALSTHPDPAVRQQSALALGASGNRAAVPALVERLADRDKVVVWDAITALGMLGRRAAAARSALEDLAKGKDKGKAARARAALKRL